MSFIRILLIILFHSHISIYGQVVQSATFEYHHRTLPSGFDYEEVYSISDFKIQHYSKNNRKGKTQKKRLKKSAHFVAGVHFLDSILSAKHYTIQLDSIQIQQLIKDTTIQKRWKISAADILSSIDSLNRIYLERKYFGRRFELPEKRRLTDSLEIIPIKWYRLEPAVIDGTPFQLTCSINLQPILFYSSNLFATPPRDKYAEWFSIYLMQEKFRLFEKSSPVAYHFKKTNLPHMIVMYTVWKKYGL